MAETAQGRGRYAGYGGSYVPETLVAALETLDLSAHEALSDARFVSEFDSELSTWVGRPTPLTRLPRLGQAWGIDLWLKREDLSHTGAHKINNAVGQALLAKRMGAEQIIAETGAGQHDTFL